MRTTRASRRVSIIWPKRCATSSCGAPLKSRGRAARVSAACRIALVSWSVQDPSLNYAIDGAGPKPDGPPRCDRRRHSDADHGHSSHRAARPARACRRAPSRGPSPCPRSPEARAVAGRRRSGCGRGEHAAHHRPLAASERSRRRAGRRCGHRIRQHWIGAGPIRLVVTLALARRRDARDSRPPRALGSKGPSDEEAEARRRAAPPSSKTSRRTTATASRASGSSPWARSSTLCSASRRPLAAASRAVLQSRASSPASASSGGIRRTRSAGRPKAQVAGSRRSRFRDSARARARAARPHAAASQRATMRISARESARAAEPDLMPSGRRALVIESTAEPRVAAARACAASPGKRLAKEAQPSLLEGDDYKLPPLALLAEPRKRAGHAGRLHRRARAECARCSKACWRISASAARSSRSTPAPSSPCTSWSPRRASSPPASSASPTTSPAR